MKCSQKTQIGIFCFLTAFTAALFTTHCREPAWAQSPTLQDKSKAFNASQSITVTRQSGTAAPASASTFSFGDMPSAIPNALSDTDAPSVAIKTSDDSEEGVDRLMFASDRARIKFSMDAVLQQSGVTGSWWNLSEQFAPEAGYKLDRAWAESWIKPGVRVDLNASDHLSLYSGLSYVGSGNIGRDVFEQGNRGFVSVEDAYFGARYKLIDETSTIDVSYGRQPYKIGSGMLISVGAMNGFERGATTTFARRAWEEAGIIKWTRGKLSLDGFFLDPNELRSSDTSTRLAGTKLEWNPEANQTLGIAYFNVFESIFPYVAAPIQLLPDGREGLNTLHVYRSWSPFQGAIPGWSISGDYAHQWNDRIDMSAEAYSVESGFSFVQRPLMPRLAYAFRSFSGDDPATSRFEKFDPLFYEGAPPLWATGSNGSFSFLNSNLLAHRVSLNLTFNPQNFVNIYYWHVRADEVNSPIQFGQAGRVNASGGEPQLVAGVPEAHLSDDFYFEYTRILTPQVFLTTGVAVSVPGRGLEELIDDPKTWTGGLINLTVKY